MAKKMFQVVHPVIFVMQQAQHLLWSGYVIFVLLYRETAFLDRFSSNMASQMSLGRFITKRMTTPLVLESGS